MSDNLMPAKKSALSGLASLAKSVPTTEPAGQEPEPIEPVEPAAGAPAIDPLLAQAEPRRVEAQPKNFRQLDQLDHAARAKSLGELAAKAAAPEQVRFLSRYPDLTIYIPLRGQADVPVKFRNGAFNTSDPAVIKAMRKHPRCGTVLFREEADARVVAVRQAAAEQLALMKRPTFAGPTTSADGNEQVFNMQQANLESVVHSAVDFGTV